MKNYLDVEREGNEWDQFNDDLKMPPLGVLSLPESIFNDNYFREPLLLIQLLF